MALSKDEALELANDFVILCIRRHDILHAYLFGSYAKGTAREYSDVDLALVLGGIRNADDPFENEEFEIFHEAQQYNSLLEVICIHRTVFDSDTDPLVREIKREGIPLFVKE